MMPFNERIEACAGCGRDVRTTVKPPRQPYCHRCIGDGSHADYEQPRRPSIRDQRGRDDEDDDL